jgi:hypothetical protein
LVKSAANAWRGSFFVPVNPITSQKKRALQTWCRRGRGELLSSSKSTRPGQPSDHTHIDKTGKNSDRAHDHIKKDEAPLFLCREPVLLEKRKYQKSRTLSRTYVRVFSHIDLRYVFKERLIVQWIKVAVGIFDDKKIKRAARFLDKELTRERLGNRAAHANRSSRSRHAEWEYLALNWQQAKVKTNSTRTERRFARPGGVDSPLSRPRVQFGERKNYSNRHHAQLPRNRRSGLTATTNHLLLPSQRRKAFFLLPIAQPNFTFSRATVARKPGGRGGKTDPSGKSAISVTSDANLLTNGV